MHHSAKQRTTTRQAFSRETRCFREASAVPICGAARTLKSFAPSMKSYSPCPKRRLSIQATVRPRRLAKSAHRILSYAERLRALWKSNARRRLELPFVDCVSQGCGEAVLQKQNGPR